MFVKDYFVIIGRVVLSGYPKADSSTALQLGVKASKRKI